MIEQKFITTKELSKRTSIPVGSLQKMVRENEIPAYSPNGRTYLFDFDEIVSIIKKTRIN